LAGEPVVLWFWAPWCTICRVEGPDVAAVAAELQGDVTFLGVPGRGAADDMRSFVDDTGTSGLQHLVDVDGSLWQRFRVVNQPSFAFVDPDGSVELFAGALGADELRARAAALSAG
jgi:thiol-disulfide isomerase/thioredoxin